MGQAQLLHPIAHPFGKHQGIVETGIGKHDDKFLAAIARDEIGLCLHHGKGDVGYFLQAFIPGRMAVGIVVLFEKIDIKQQQADAFRCIRVALLVQMEQVIEPGLHAAPVDATGEAIHGGLVFQNQVGGMQFVTMLVKHVFG